MFNLIDPSTITTWKHAIKVKPIRALPVANAIHGMVLHHLRLVTYEGMQEIERSNYLCIGEAGEMWQQDRASMFRKYVPVSVDSETGWSTYAPRGEAAVEVYQTTLDDAKPSTGQHVSVYARWGETHEGHDHPILTGTIGDYIIRYAPDDVAIVRRSVFDSTYQIL